MIEHRQPVTVAADVLTAWSYVSDMANWAANMPGYQDYVVVDQTDSLWTLKVGVGALVKTVRVLVHIETWSGPDRVDFRYRLESEPVSGNGSYRAIQTSAAQTEIVLTVNINGGGPMAPAWEAMARPILPRLAKGFAEELKKRIEMRTQPRPDARATLDRESIAGSSPVRRFLRWLRRLRTFGRKTAEESTGR